MEKKFNVVGARLPMMDAAQKAKGSALFTDDLILPGMLYGRVLRSPLPHAKILNIDTSKAAKMSGVKGVATGSDIPDRQYGIVPMAKDEYALAKGKVRYIGDDVAAVCAIDPEIAEEALELIDVDYEELPAVFDPFEAKKDGAPVIHEGIKNNTSFAIKKEFGDVKKAFAESDAIFEDTFFSQAVNHAPLEPHAALAQFDPLNGELTLWSSTQIPFFLRRNLSNTLQIPESKVRVIKPKVGGGFGQKIDMFAKDFCAAWFAMRLGKPVKFIYDREEVFISTRQRHPMYITVKTISILRRRRSL
jgi:4-hydroxybenzoyl-CoA reductase subunit alpha